MKKILFVIIPCLFIITMITADEKADFRTAEKFAPENLRKMVGTRNVVPVWIDGTDSFIYKFKKNGDTGYFLVDPKKGKKRNLFKEKKLARKLSVVTGNHVNSSELEFSGISYSRKTGVFKFTFNEKEYAYHIRKGRLAPYEKNKFDNKKIYRKSPDGKWAVFAIGHNIFLEDTNRPDADPKQLTTDGEPWFSYSNEEGEEQNEKLSGTIARWFPDSKKIYVLRRDKRKVDDLFLVHSTAQPRPTLESYKYAMAGDKNLPVFHLSVIDITTGQLTVINIKKWKDQQVGSEGTSGIYPGEDSSRLWFTRTTRDWKNVELCKTDTSTGKVTVIMQEKWEPYWSADFQQFHPASKNGEFLWWSEKTGRGHLYLADEKGSPFKPITAGEYSVTDVLKVDHRKKQLIFSACGKDPEDPYYSKYYSVNFNGKDLMELTPETGTHTLHLSPSGNYYVDTWSTVEKPDRSVLKDKNGRTVLNLETLDITRLQASGWEPPVRFKVKAADNRTDLYGVMWKPFNMVKGKKYPVISYVYPGPQGEPVPRTFFLVRDKRVSNIPIAQLGFIVVSVGQRGGSPLRTRAYHQYGYGNARDYPLEDNKYAIEQLAEKYNFMDISRVGIYGRSGGGFMSAAAILVYPDFYKTAVSSCGNHDNNIYDYVWGEMHYGLEKKITTNIEKAGNLKGRLLLIHGEVDNNVHPANTMRLADELIKKGKRFDMMIFPGKRHAYDEYTSYIERMMWYYFAEHLMGDKRDNIDLFKYK